MALGLSLDSPPSRFRAALVLAIVADAVQLIGFPLFVEGAVSPLDDILDFIVAVALSGMLGWHWEFMPSLLGKLVPGVDLVPLWTLASPAFMANGSNAIPKIGLAISRRTSPRSRSST